MAYEGFANSPLVTTTLNGAINNSVTSLVVTSAALFPTSTNYVRLLIDSEIILVTSRSGTTCTVSRGAEGTAAASHATGANVTIIVTAAALNSLRPIYKLKSADETVTSSAVMQNDNDLIFPVNANEHWDVRYVLMYHAATAGDVKFGFTAPASTTYLATGHGLAVPATGPSGDVNHGYINGSGFMSFGGAGAGVVVYANVNAVFLTTTAGNITLQWAQDTSNGTGTVLLVGSRLIALLVA